MQQPTPKKGHHPRNKNRFRYDFDALVQVLPELAGFLSKRKTEHLTLDFSNPQAVKTLNRAILLHYYGIKGWDIPAGYLCPPIPGRADYIHQVADLLASEHHKQVPTGPQVKVLDIGTGANCVYPLLGHSEYGWAFVGSDIDEAGVAAAARNIAQNSWEDHIDIRLQPSTTNIFRGVMQDQEVFDLVLCNPPFHASAEAAMAGNQRKWKNLGKKQRSGKSQSPKAMRNFGGQSNELWCKGGESRFIKTMIRESYRLQNRVLWFTTLVSKQSNLPAIYEQLKTAEASTVKTLEMAQGQKISRAVCWSYQPEQQRAEWGLKRWTQR